MVRIRKLGAGPRMGGPPITFPTPNFLIRTILRKVAFYAPLPHFENPGWPTCASTGGCKLGGASRPPCRRPTASGTIRLCFKRLSAAASTWWRAGSGEWAKRAPAPARYHCPFGCLPTTWPGRRCVVPHCVRARPGGCLAL